MKTEGSNDTLVEDQDNRPKATTELPDSEESEDKGGEDEGEEESWKYIFNNKICRNLSIIAELSAATTPQTTLGDIYSVLPEMRTMSTGSCRYSAFYESRYILGKKTHEFRVQRPIQCFQVILLVSTFFESYWNFEKLLNRIFIQSPGLRAHKMSIR